MDHDEFNENVANTTTEVVRNGKKGWLPAKPILLNNWYQFKQRLIAAKAVLKGNAVAVKWH
jgi:hypothetical protein